MEYKNEERIIRLCADIGNYVADAHVPLHTTVNYNGQLTGQTGLHAFWESRIPELFAQDHFSAWVGPARYIEDPEEFIRSEEHTSELQSRGHLVCRLLLEKKNKKDHMAILITT